MKIYTSMVRRVELYSEKHDRLGGSVLDRAVGPVLPDGDDNEVSLASFVEDLKPEKENCVSGVEKKSNNKPEKVEDKTRKSCSKAYSGGGGESLRNNNKAGELGKEEEGEEHCGATGTLKVFTEANDFTRDKSDDVENPICILVSEEDKEATFVEPSKRGRYLLPSFVCEL
ncbi:hypothetical protein IFM89_027773 [Coptis chinensis]|uniref:Uncharacterized protein n=1 Tax=Coptis chinensis TaxID=261450 RepID=A0A835I757_9MAGN|nr:hypothetical protein IFM89_027773 [Coptis chinensis]